jgi:cob(I)alamin adenosyltransferase
MGIRMKRGLLAVLTGDGKGKTTAAIGMAIRALGHGWRVCMVQFVKGALQTGEWKALERFDDLLDVHVKGHGFIYGDEDVERDRGIAEEAWDLVRDALSSTEYRLVILDELTYLLKYDLITELEVCTALRSRRPGLHVVITGRDTPSCLIELADLVTEMKEVKHPLQSGIKAQKGIEF